MNKNKISILIILLSAVFACVIALPFMVSADSEPEFTDAEICDLYSVGEVFTVPTVKVRSDGRDYDTDCSIIFPDGSVKYADKFELVDAGDYSIVFSAVINGKTYSESYFFTVQNTSVGLLKTENAECKIGKSDFYDGLYGAQFDAEAGVSVTYGKVINLANNTKNDLLIEMVAAARKQESEDFSEFYVTLTDIYDQNNYVKIKIYSAKANSWFMSYVQGKAPGQRFCGLESGYPNFGITAGGCVINHSFGAYYPTMDQNAGSTVKLYFDYAERAVYTYSGGLIKKVVDFDDESYMTKLWGGFTTGEVRLTVTVGDVAASPRFVIKSIDGNMFFDEYLYDEKSPTIVVNAPTQVPFAVVGKPYSVFEAYAYDNTAIKVFDKEVYYNLGSGNETAVAISDGAFIPSRAGDYALIYYATDNFGNETKKSVSVLAKNPEDISELNISLDSYSDCTVDFGEKIKVRQYSVSGGVGYENVKVELFKDGNFVKTLGEDSFNISATGEYKIVYTVTDYVGNSDSAHYKLTVVLNECPIIDGEIKLPSAFIENIAYELPIVLATDYSSGSAVKVPAVISAKLNGKDIPINSDVLKATESGEVNVTYTYTNSSAKTTVYEKTIPVLSVKNSGAIDMTKYFITESMTVAAKSDSIEFTALSEGAYTEFIKPVQSKNFVIGIGISTTAFEADFVELELSDKYSSDQTIIVRIYKNGFVSLNGGDLKAVSYVEEKDRIVYKINYDETSKSLSDDKSYVFGIVKENVLGKEFNGFKSNEIFVKATAKGVVGESKIYVTIINNHVMTRSGRDNVPPQIYISDLIGGRSKLGAETIVYSSQAYDVLNGISEFTVSVKNIDTGKFANDVNGIVLKNVDAKKEYRFILSEYGKYQIEYAAVDDSGKNVSATKIVGVYDDISPEINIKGNVPTEGKVGNEIILPEYVTADNLSLTTTSYIVVVAPDGRQFYITKIFVPDKVGVWLVRYFAMDTSGQMAVKEFRLNIQE